MRSIPRKTNNTSSQTKLRHEEWLAQYSFSLASLFFAVILQFQHYLTSSDPTEQMFYDNLIFFAFIIFGIPFVFRITAFFGQFVKSAYITKHLTKHQRKTYETYKVYMKLSQTDPDGIEKSKKILYFTAMNNWMWFSYLLIILFIAVTVCVDRLFNINPLLLNCVPSLVLLVYRVWRISTFRTHLKK